MESRLRYLMWRAGISKGKPINVKLTGGQQLILRPPPASDIGTAMEVFVCEAYRSPLPLAAEDIRHIQDIGANVGFSVVYFSACFPNAKIEAFEPHPVHVRQLSSHILLNNLGLRVTVHAAAVGTKNEQMFLTDAETHSSLVKEEGPNRLMIPVVDWLELAANTQIDLLKMDIEGGEYSILFDQRFADLKIRNLVIEWHVTSARPRGDQEIIQRLNELGYRIEHGPQGELQEMRFGLLWGYRGAANQSG